jgi:hypothetical protein
MVVSGLGKKKTLVLKRTGHASNLKNKWVKWWEWTSNWWQMHSDFSFQSINKFDFHFSLLSFNNYCHLQSILHVQKKNWN